MSKDIPLHHRDMLIQIGIAISTLRKVRGMLQKELAKKTDISRGLMSIIEAPNMANNFTLVTFFSIADALDVDPADLLNSAMFPDKVINKNKKTEK